METCTCHIIHPCIYSSALLTTATAAAIRCSILRVLQQSSDHWRHHSLAVMAEDKLQLSPFQGHLHDISS